MRYQGRPGYPTPLSRVLGGTWSPGRPKELAGRVHVWQPRLYLSQLSPRIRQELVEFLHIDHNPELPFNEAYENTAASVYAVHGHVYDKVNWHDPANNRWAMGDAIVLRVVNRFAAEACDKLAVTEKSPLGRQLHEIDNIEPNLDVLVYVRWLIETGLGLVTEKNKVRGVWDRVITEFIEDSMWKNPQYADSDHKRVLRAMQISRDDTLAKLGEFVAGLFRPPTAYHRAADELAAQVKKYRFIVFGHTHQPAFAPLVHRANNRPSYYINTGCWRRIVTRPFRDRSGPFVRAQVATYFWIDHSRDLGPRYELSRICHAT